MVVRKRSGRDRCRPSNLRRLRRRVIPHRSRSSADLPIPAETMRYLRTVIDSQGPFDACLGFSQGAAVAAIVSALLARPSLHPAFASPPLRADQGPLKAVIVVAGFKLEEPGTWYAADESGKGKMGTPSLHVLGDADLIVGDGARSP